VVFCLEEGIVARIFWGKFKEGEEEECDDWWLHKAKKWNGVRRIGYGV
jgi:hypothetical protein